MVLDGRKPPYVSWSFKFTYEPTVMLQEHFGTEDLDGVHDNHILRPGSDIGFFDNLGNHCFRDVFGVVCDRSIDKDIGNPKEPVITGPSSRGYSFPTAWKEIHP